METLFHEFMRLFREPVPLLTEFVHAHGYWVYGLFFLIVFCETGLVVTPLLPGDSLLFAAGAITAITQSPEEVAKGTAGLQLGVLIAVFLAAALCGDNVNYWIGRTIGPRAFSGRVRFLNPQHLEKTRRFFEVWGGKAVVLARFVPIVRTFTPFVAGVGAMSYPRFLVFSFAGACAWAGGISTAGYFFGDVPFVKKNFSIVVVGIVIVSLLPIVIGWWRSRR